MITKKELDELKKPCLDIPQPTLRPDGPDADLVDALVREKTEWEREARLEAGQRTLDQAAESLEQDLAFASREGLAQAAFEKSVGDDFNTRSDEVGRLAHEFNEADERLAMVIDEALEAQELDPDGKLDPDIASRVEQANREALDAESRYDASRNNGLPLDPTLDVDKETYILRTTERKGDEVEMTREEYIEVTRAPSIEDRGPDRSRDR